jgi:hypothetical protein
MLAVLSDFNWMHIHYVRALAQRFDLLVAWSGERGAGPVDSAQGAGIRMVPIGRLEEVGPGEVRERLRDAVGAFDPSVLLVAYYLHERLTVMARELVDGRAVVVHDVWDALTALKGVGPDSDLARLERAALDASDLQLFVSRALRSYLEEAHGIDLEPTSLIVPHGFARDTVAPPSPKLSAQDGRVHLVLAGSALPEPGQGRWYGDVIRRLVATGVVVHSHFYCDSTAPYERLAEELPDYRPHPTVGHSGGTTASEAFSRYDLMGVFYENDEIPGRAHPSLTAGLPTKAVGGWLHGGIPAVCFPWYRGVVERIEDHGIGFVVGSWDDLREIVANRPAIDAATQRCLECRDRFTSDHQADRIREFVGQLDRTA